MKDIHQNQMNWSYSCGRFTRYFDKLRSLRSPVVNVIKKSMSALSFLTQLYLGVLCQLIFLLYNNVNGFQVVSLFSRNFFVVSFCSAMVVDNFN